MRVNIGLFEREPGEEIPPGLEWMYGDSDDDDSEDEDEGEDEEDFIYSPVDPYDSDDGLDAVEAAYIWASSGKDEGYTFGYSEEELEGAL